MAKYIPVPTTSGLTEDEERVVTNLVEAWNAFVKISGDDPDSLNDFRQGIHQCQQIIALRAIRRLFPIFWNN